MMATAGAAQAAGPSDAEGDISTKGLPQCIEAWDDAQGDVHVVNNCSSSYRYKVVMAFAPDLSCQTVKAGWEHTYDDPTGRFDGVQSC
ncbi:hypothetical protein [Brachybacterium sacelli]|uniref:Uncharacterized protein n=2 Tax=Brachybacterium sacelli TaxID=173364 RepID=A0ABS4X6W8_9MICO|nr:hypothetical protein [Brachybacterium sacelli]MBP2384086.1 hypothetical protein [Brachybacterium sacelli]